jgi:hypothetical protein
MVVVSLEELSIVSSAELVIGISEELLVSAISFGVAVESAVEGLSEEQAASAIRAIVLAV